VGAAVAIAIVYLLTRGISGAIDLALTGEGGPPHAHRLCAQPPADYHRQHGFRRSLSEGARRARRSAGLVLLILPGIIFAMFMFANFIVVDRELGPIEAMKESSRITRGKRWTLLWLSLAILVINLLGLIALVVGLLVSVPVTWLALAHAYRLFAGRTVPDAVMAAPAA
jgi:hypothetical protein